MVGRILDKHLDFEVERSYINIYERADIDKAKGVLKFLVQVPLQDSIYRDLKDFLYEFYKNEGVSKIHVSARKITDDKTVRPFFYNVDYEKESQNY